MKKLIKAFKYPNMYSPYERFFFGSIHISINTAALKADFKKTIIDAILSLKKRKCYKGYCEYINVQNNIYSSHVEPLSFKEWKSDIVNWKREVMFRQYLHLFKNFDYSRKYKLIEYLIY